MRLFFCFSPGEYSCLSVDLVFKRQFSYYLITIYVPGCMLVIVSWVNFWLDPKAVPARVALGVTTLLTMSTQVRGISNRAGHGGPHDGSQLQIRPLPGFSPG